MSAERRKHDRMKVDLECSVSFEEVDLEGNGRIEEMSVGGCFVATTAIAPFGRRVRLAFSLDRPARQLSVEGVVRWTSSRGMGVQFLALGVVAVYALTEHLADRPPASLPPPQSEPPARANLLARWQEARRRDGAFAKAALVLAEAAKQTLAPPPSVPGDDLGWDLDTPSTIPPDVEPVQVRLEALELERDDLLQERDALKAALALRDEQLEQAQLMLAERARQVETLRQAVGASASRPDDLTRIKGIGPKFADGLRKAGVTGYADIAAWTEADLEAFAERLGTSVTRIRNDGWIESAAALSASQSSPQSA